MNAPRSPINRILLAVAAVWILIILTATITAVCVQRSMKSAETEIAFPPMQNFDGAGSGDATYTGVGSVRAITASGGEGDDGVPVIVTAWFSYPKDDRVFFEELASKSTLMRKTIASYFSDRTKSELEAAGEEKVKTELRNEINSLLTLGQVGTFYFSEYIFLE